MNRLFLIVSLLFVHVNSFANELTITNIRVGQGDATLIQGPKNQQGNRINILIDAGNTKNRDGGNILRTVLYKNNVKKLDYLIVSHYDADHIGGIVSGKYHGVSFLDGWNSSEEDDIDVYNFVDRGDKFPPQSIAYLKYIATAKSRGTRISLTGKKDVQNFDISLGNGARLYALASNGFVRGKQNKIANVSTENERSISLLLSYNKFDYLISGDLIGRKHGNEDAKVEAAVGEYIKNNNIIVDVLHVNHHGANNGSEASFLKNIRPTIAVISAGNGNKFSHPNRGTLKRLADAGVYRIIQTSWGTTRNTMPRDIRNIQAIYQNDVIIKSNGKGFNISTSRNYKIDDNPNFKK